MMGVNGILASATIKVPFPNALCGKVLSWMSEPSFTALTAPQDRRAASAPAVHAILPV